MSASIVRIVRASSASSVDSRTTMVRRPRAYISADRRTMDPQTASAGWLGGTRRLAGARWRAGRRRSSFASLPATIAVAVMLAGCATASPEPTPTPTTYERGTVVDMDAYGDLVDVLEAVGSDPARADRLIETVCTAPQSPQELIDSMQSSASVLWIRLSVMAGCPERKDWS